VLVIYTPVAILLWKIDPNNAMAHSGELKPIIFTAFLSSTPMAVRLFENARASLKY
jgi:hypothetical protein